MATRIIRSVISKELIGHISRALLNLESSVIVAPMQAGKTYVARGVRDAIRESVEIVHFEFPARAAILSEIEVLARLRQPAADAQEYLSIREFFIDLRRQCVAARKPMALIISHLDALSRELARTLLIEIRAAVNDPDVSIAALITAESHVFDLLLGPHSEFNCAYEYILQGYDLPLFSLQLKRLSKEFELRLDSDPEIERSLWGLTGGSIYLLRQCLLAWVDYRFSRSDTAPAHLDLATAQLMADRLATPGPRECPMFRRVIEIIDTDPEYLATIDSLVSEDRVEAAPEPPHAFELSGLAYYREGYLMFSSEMLARFVLREFSPQRRGYLYALADKWDVALQRWGKSTASVNVTPTFHERVITQEVIRRLREKLKLGPRARADALFRDALGALFGVNAVHQCAMNANDEWVFDPELSEEARANVMPALNGKTWEFSQPGCIGAFLSSTQPVREAILVFDGGAPLWLHRELRDLVSAYARSVRDERQRESEKNLKRLEHALSDTIRGILNGLYVNLLSHSDVLAKALSDLQGALSFGEADVWLVSEDGTQLERAASLGSAEPSPDVLNLADSRLTTIAFNAGSAALLSSAHDHIPRLSLVLNPDAPKQVGWLIIAFKRGTAVSEGEVNALKVFAGQLGAAVDHGRRILRINSALDSIVEPIIVLDRSGTVVYSNSAGQKLSKNTLETEFRTMIDAALAGQRVVDFPSSVGGAPYEGTTVFQPLRGARGLIGVMVHIQPKSYYAHILNAALALERANSRAEALESLLDVFSSLGHQWIRTYRMEGDQLVPDRCVDPGRPTIEAAFNSRNRLQLPPRDASPTWVAVNARQPHVFAYDTGFKDGELFVTPLGLTVIAQVDPPEKELLDKKPGDYWIDFPLMKGTEVIGKFTIPCAPDITPERFQMFNVLASIVGSSFSRVTEREARGSGGAGVNIEKIRRLQGQIFDRLGPLEILREALEEPAGDRGVFDFAAYGKEIGSALDQMREWVERLDSAMESF